MPSFLVFLTLKIKSTSVAQKNVFCFVFVNAVRRNIPLTHTAEGYVLSQPFPA